MASVKFKLYNCKQLTCALITDIKNASDVKEQLMTGVLKCAVVKPSLIIDMFQICSAANKALLADSRGKLVTKSVYTEILFNLSISKNISQSLLKFGINDEDSEIFIATFEDDAEVSFILSKIDGNVTDMNNLSKFCSEKAIRKVYKINEQELMVSSLSDLIVSKLSTKDFVNY